MKVLIIGSGAREHALALRISQDPGVEVICAPGNGGMSEVGTCLPVRVDDKEAIVALAKEQAVDLVVIGPEGPLVVGVVDALRDAGIEVFGPERRAAILEGSKIFSKQFLARHRIPTADFEVFDAAEDAEAYVRAANRPLVVKADGLAAGKGVVVAQSTEEALEAIDVIMRKRAFGEAGDRVLIEECIVGQEVSYHVISDGKRYFSMAPSQDHKRAFDGDRGPNTGGMGAYSPPPVVTPEIEAKVLSTIVEPTLDGMAKEGVPFRGVLFIGLMIVEDRPYVLEYNVRFGDPECEALMARWSGPVLPLFLGPARGDFGNLEPAWAAPASLCVVLASGGYPGPYETGREIRGVEAAAAIEGVTVCHAGTRRDGDRLLTAGGRVLTVTAIGADVDEAAERAYRAADLIEFEGKHLRRDIGHHARTR